MAKRHESCTDNSRRYQNDSIVSSYADEDNGDIGDAEGNSVRISDIGK